METAFTLVRPRTSDWERTKPPPGWCSACRWQLTRPDTTHCPECDNEPVRPPGAKTSEGAVHLRRLLVARVIRDLGPSRSGAIARELGLTRACVLSAVSNSAGFAHGPDGFTLTPVGEELLRRYSAGGGG